MIYNLLNVLQVVSCVKKVKKHSSGVKQFKCLENIIFKPNFPFFFQMWGPKFKQEVQSLRPGPRLSLSYERPRVYIYSLCNAFNTSNKNNHIRKHGRMSFGNVEQGQWQKSRQIDNNSPAIRLGRFPSVIFPARSWTIRAVWNAARRAWCTLLYCRCRHHRRCRPSARNRRPAAVAVGPACRRCTIRRPCSVTAN